MVVTRQMLMAASVALTPIRFPASVRLLACVLAVSVSLLFIFMASTFASTLPDERSEAMYHHYDGGGVEVHGPALLLRKNFKEKYSFTGSYYVDDITSASIDVVTNASEYSETRTEYGIGATYLHRDTLMSFSYSDSDEDDYEASTFNIDFAQEVFGGMSTIYMGFTRGDDTVMRVDNDFEEDIDRYRYRLGLSQIFTRTLVVNFAYEGIAEEGFLNNPYRSARLLGASVPEVYPDTRTSNAFSAEAMKYWQSELSTRLGYRYFTDTWDINAHSIEAGFTKNMGGGILLDASFRYHDQDAASFYSDNFMQEFKYMARDKELSTFSSYTLGVRATWELFKDRPGTFNRGTLSIGYDRIHFDYDDFTDVRNGELYDFDSDVFQIYFSTWY